MLPAGMAICCQDPDLLHRLLRYAREVCRDVWVPSPYILRPSRVLTERTSTPFGGRVRIGNDLGRGSNASLRPVFKRFNGIPCGCEGPEHVPLPRDFIEAREALYLFRPHGSYKPVPIIFGRAGTHQRIARAMCDKEFTAFALEPGKIGVEDILDPREKGDALQVDTGF